MPELSPISEHDIAQLERVLAEKKAQFEQQKNEGTIEKVPHMKDVIREIVQEKLAVAPGAQTAPPSSYPQADQPTSAQPQTGAIPSYASDEIHAKVQELIEVAFAKSLNQAIELAKATGNPALIDGFHDIIVDEIYDRLVQTGKLEKI